MKKLISLTLVLSMFLLGCASSTVIKSKPSGASVYVDDQYIGNTPVEYEDASTLFTTPEVKLTAEGYQPLQSKLNKTDVRVWPILGAIAVLVPILWVTGYSDEYNYELQPEKAATPLINDEISQ